MRTLNCSNLLRVLLLVTATWTLVANVCVEAHYGGQVKELTQLTFDSFLSSSAHSPILVQFYSPHCKYCMQFARVYEEINEALREEANVTRVDGEEYRVLRMRFRVDGFPSFYLIHKRQVWQFEGPRKFDEMLQFVQTGGAKHGKKFEMLGGPLSPYWSVISTLFILADRLRLFALNYEQRPFTLLAIIFGLLFALLFAVAIIIHIITTPRIARPPQARPPLQAPHPHAE